MKQNVCIIMAAVMALLCVACAAPSGGSPSQAQPAAPQAGASQQGAAPQPQDRIVIEYWHRNSETAGGPTINKYAEEFNNSQDKYTVKPVFMTDAYQGVMLQLQAAAAAGSAPGVVQVGYYWLNYLAENYQFVDLRDLDASYLDNYLPNVIALCTATDGRVAGLPYSFSCPVMYYNTELLAKAGLDTANPPKTIDELYEWARIIKKETSQFGLAIAAAGDFWLEQWEIESNGGRMVNYNDDGTLTATFASPEGAEALQKIADLINIDKAATYVLGENIREAFTSGNVGMIAATIGWSAAINDAASFDFVTGPMPAYGSTQPRVPVGGNFLAITALTPEEQAGSWEWLKFISTQQGYYDWTVGTGYYPPRKDVESMPEFQEYLKVNPLLKACQEQISYVVPFVSFPGDVGLQIEQALLDMRDTIMNGDQSAAQALTDMQDRANSLMHG